MKQKRAHVSNTNNAILLRGIRENNLKSVNVDIPRGKLTLITGLSGSGKSSLAFDTLYAEGQRRYVESLSAYARQFLGRMRKPESDLIAGIPPAIAIEQRVATRSPRSTVATSTELYEYFRLLFARVGKCISPISGTVVKKHNSYDVLKYAESLPAGTRLYLIVQLHSPEGRSMRDHLEILSQQGYTRLFCQGNLHRIEELLATKEDFEGKACYLLIDRLPLVEDSREYASRLVASTDTAFFEGRGSCTIRAEVPTSESVWQIEERTFSNVFEADGRVFQEPSPEMFSFNNPIGACPLCEGFGKVMGIDEDLVIPDKSLSIYEDAVACWNGPKSRMWQDEFIRLATAHDFPIHKPYHLLSKEEQWLLWEGIDGDEQADYEGKVGINPYFDMLRRDIYKVQNRVRLAHFRGKSTCPQCHGMRLKEDALCVRIAGINISELCSMSIEEAKAFFDKLQLDDADYFIAKRLLEEIEKRLAVLLDVGLPYLQLDRLSNTLSGGEGQRITLATQLGSSLVGSLYVLDEPSIGLHQRDAKRLIQVLHRLRDIGNTVVVVEHDEEIIRAADCIIDIGPEAGRMGGEIVFAGTLDEVNEQTPGYTAAYLSGREKIELPSLRRKWQNFIDVKGAYLHNLKEVDARFPLNTLSCITGVSGSGKSSLAKGVLYEGVKRLLENGSLQGIPCKGIEGDLKMLTEVQYVDQNSIGKSTRSNPATYIGAYDEIRKLYSSQRLAKQMGYLPYYFSFNKEGGRCEQCKGEGLISVEMQFMADIKLTCEECQGKRFKREILDVEYQGVNIYQILEMTVNQAIEFFGQFEADSHAIKIAEKLRCLQDVGLGYIKLGQNSSSLSGGENQRVKLAYYLGQAKPEPCLFIFDEPSTGLHFHDIKTLLKALNALIDKGHTVLLVEHNLELIKSADYVIDMGPEGGDAGGKLLFAGTPEELVKCNGSYTGQALLKVLAKN